MRPGNSVTSPISPGVAVTTPTSTGGICALFPGAGSPDLPQAVKSIVVVRMASAVRVFCLDRLKGEVVVHAARIFGMGDLLMGIKEVGGQKRRANVAFHRRRQPWKLV